MPIDNIRKYRNLRNLTVRDLNTAIYRIMPIDQLMGMFETNKLVIPKINKWEDPYENFFLKCEFWNGSNQLSTLNVREGIYGQCWSKFKDSDALWRLYSSDKKSVRIKTTIGKLFDTIYTSNTCSGSSYIGAVAYETKSDITKWVKNQDVNMTSINKIIIDSLFMKRNNFSHEKEVRIAYISPTHALNPDLVEFDIDIHNFIENITFDPRTDDAYYKANRQLFKRVYGYDLSRISKSVLYEFNSVRVEIR